MLSYDRAVLICFGCGLFCRSNVKVRMVAELLSYACERMIGKARMEFILSPTGCHKIPCKMHEQAIGEGDV